MGTISEKLVLAPIRDVLLHRIVPPSLSSQKASSSLGTPVRRPKTSSDIGTGSTANIELGYPHMRLLPRSSLFFDKSHDYCSRSLLLPLSRLPALLSSSIEFCYQDIPLGDKARTMKKKMIFACFSSLGDMPVRDTLFVIQRIGPNGYSP